MFKKLLSSQNGFSIIQGMLLASAVAGMAYVGTKLTTDQKLAAKGTESKGKVEQLHSMIFSILQNKNHCTTTYSLNSPSYGVLRGPCGPACSRLYQVFAPSPITQITTAGSTAPVFTTNAFAPGTIPTYMSNSVTLDAIELTQPSPFFAELKILYGKLDHTTAARTGKGFGATQVAKTIKLKIQRGGMGNAIESCYAIDEVQNENMVQEFCEGLAPGFFTWDQYTQKCDLNDHQCPTGQVNAGYDSNGNRRCFEIKDWMNVGNLIDQASTSSCNATASSSVGFVISGSQVKVQCNGAAGVNCVGSWGGCVAGNQTYTITTPASGGGSACPATNGQTQACGCTPAINGGWSLWGAYGACSGGYKWRYRTCNNPAPSCGGAACIGSNSSNSTTGCGGCFVAGTQIAMADGSAKNIEDVLKGDQLQDAHSKTATVQKLMSSDYWGEIHSINGGPYFFTPNHPFMTVEGWKSLAPLATKKESPGLIVGQLKTGDILMKENGLELILTLDAKVTEEKIYNFELDASHSYVADEYKVHNKCAAPACSMGEHWYSCDPTNCSGICTSNTPDPVCGAPVDPLL